MTRDAAFRRPAGRRWLNRGRVRIQRLIKPRGVSATVGGVDGGIDHAPDPPACPAGWHTGPPHFVGVGVQRCGTSRWFDLIATHPDVVQSNAAKELHYFDHFYEGGCTAPDIARYHEYFPRIGERKTGEWTPLYLSAPWIPKLLAAAAPDAALLVLLRDPVERYLSALALNTRVAARRGAPLSRYAPLEAFERGLYHAQLVNLLNYFDRSQILILQYERCTRDPRSELRRTFAFLGLDPAFAPSLEAHPKHQPEKPTLDRETRAAYVNAYREDVLGLVSSFPELDVGEWPNFAHLAARRPPSA